MTCQQSSFQKELAVPSNTDIAVYKRIQPDLIKRVLSINLTIR